MKHHSNISMAIQEEILHFIDMSEISVLSMPYIRVKMPRYHHVGFFWELVRSITRCFQLPRTSFFHHTALLDPKVTSAGVLSFISKSHSDEITG